jgi:uncharacterized membrane protein
MPEMKNNLLYFTALFFLMLITGVFWGTWFTLTRSIGSFSSSEFMHIGQVIIANVAIPMRIIVPAGLLLIILSLWSGRKKKGMPLGMMSLVLFIAVLLMTLIVLVPIDNDIKAWTVNTVPGNWEVMRGEWAAWHAARTFLSLAGFICFEVFTASENKLRKVGKYKLEKKVLSRNLNPS